MRSVEDPITPRPRAPYLDAPSGIIFDGHDPDKSDRGVCGCWHCYPKWLLAHGAEPEHVEELLVFAVRAEEEIVAHHLRVERTNGRIAPNDPTLAAARLIWPVVTKIRQAQRCSASRNLM